MKTKEAIRKKLIQYIKLTWGIKNIGQLNPLTHLMIEEVCNELYLLEDRLENLNVSILNKLTQTLSPPTFGYIRPGHGILKIDPSVPIYKIGRHTNFMLKNDSGEGQNALQFLFAPVVNTRIYDINLLHLFYDRKLWSTDSVGQRTVIKQSTRRGRYNTLWLGVGIHPDIRSLKGVSVFLDFEHLPDHHPYYDLLSETTWSLDGITLEMATGITVNSSKVLTKIESDILDFYCNHFQTIQSDIDVQGISKRSLPEELAELFDDQVTTPPLYWLSVSFPEGILPEDLEKIAVGFNAFPVVNRYYNKSTVAGKELEDSISLVSGEEQEFLDMDMVIDSRGTVYHPGNTLNEPATYTIEPLIQKTENKLRIIDCLERLVDIIHDERAVFPEIDNESIMRVLDSVSATHHKEVQKMELNRLKKTVEVASLRMNPAEEVHVVHISYWSTLADRVNGIPGYTQLMASKIPELNKSNALLLTETCGGRNFYDEESIRAINSFYLTSKGRILTRNNIVDFCMIELGRYVEQIDVARTTITSHKQKEGIIMVMEIVVTPIPRHLEYLKQKSVFKDLLVRLYQLSPGNFNYRIKLIE